MTNVFNPVLSTIVARTLPTLREAAWFPRLVNRDAENQAPAGYGDTISMVIPTALAVDDVAPQAAPVTPGSYTPARAQVSLNRWRKSGFYLTDKERSILLNGGAIGQAEEAVKVLANDVNAYLIGLYTGSYGFAGSAGAVPFAGTDLTDASDARKVLNQQLAPFSDRRLVLDVNAEGNLVKHPYIAAQYARGDAQTNREGTVTRVMGFDVYMDQQMVTHTSPAFSAGDVTVNGVNAAGAGSTDGGRTGTISLAKATNAGALVKGDLLTFAGDSQQYVVTADATLIVGNTTVSIAPALKVATTGGEAVTKVGTHAVNLAFHRDAIAFASRPLATAANRENVVTVTDPVTGLAIRLELVRQHKQDYYEFDILYGATMVRPELACRLIGQP